MDYKQLLEEPTSQANNKAHPMMRHRVHFNDGTNNTVRISVFEIRSCANFTANEKAATWYQPSEYERIKGAAMIIARGIRDQDAFETMKHSYQQVLLTAYQSIIDSQVVISERDTKLFSHWISVGHSRRGLERWSVPALFALQHRRRAISVQAVLDAQSICSSEDLALFGNDKSKVIATLYSHLTKGSREFALLMGQADQVAAVSNASWKDKFKPSYIVVEPFSHTSSCCKSSCVGNV